MVKGRDRRGQTTSVLAMTGGHIGARDDRFPSVIVRLPKNLLMLPGGALETIHPDAIGAQGDKMGRVGARDDRVVSEE